MRGSFTSSWEATGKVSGADGYSFLSRLLVKKMPLMNFPRYIHETPRDFFYLTRRDTLPGARLAAPDGGEPRPLGPVDTPNNDYPYFAVSTATSNSDQSAILRFDPRELSPVGPVTESVVWFPGIPVPGTPKTTTPTGRKFLTLFAGQFSIDDEPKEGALVLARETIGERSPSDIYCLDTSGFLNIVEGTKTAPGSSSKELTEALGCAQSIAVEARDRPKFEVDKAGAWLPLYRTRRPAVRQIFVETPIVPPTVWGIPQAKRAAWNQNFEPPRSVSNAP